MKRAAATVLAAVTFATFVAFHAPTAHADTPVCPSPSTATATDARTCQTAFDQLRQRLGADLSAALTTQQRLSQTMASATARAQYLAAEVGQEEAKITNLQNQIAALDDQIAALELRIENERQQVRTMARAIYRQPTSFLDVIASSGNLADALTASADLVVAGERAHALQEKLKSDLVTVQADRDARQSDLDEENATLVQIQSGADELTSIQGLIDDVASQLVTLIAHIRSAVSTLGTISADDQAAVATLMEQQETTLSAQAQTAAWALAGVGAGEATALIALPAGFGPAGLALSWPMAGTLTQRFGPTNFALEPPLGSYPHFHTGIDIAAPEGTPVSAAADGLVVSVKHTSFGYGNYVIIAHGGGLFTLYGHLADTSVVEGQRVVRTQLIGHEGATGLATGPHLHFEVRYNGAVVDPLVYLSSLPPR